MTVLLSLIFVIGLSVSVLAHQAHARSPHPTDHPMHLAQATSPQPAAETQPPLFKNLGNHHHPISTKNALAQRYFDQGLTLSYGFNHMAAARSFKAAAQLDPQCAMCYWGIALVLGPNINAPMGEDALPEAQQALQQAKALGQYASEKERAYIQALATRYPSQAVSDRKPFDLAYANAMREIASRYPDDLDAATLFAESLMTTTPWDYWEEDGTPKPEGKEIMAVLESVLKREPNHPGANHLYIHAVEKERPDLGVLSADRLMKLVPNSGHLVHMASHIYIRVGRYHDAVVSNQGGIAADNLYVTQCHAQGIYPLMYMPHNHHFLWFAAQMTGQSQLALEAAQNTAKVDPQFLRHPVLAGTVQHFHTIPMFTYARFGKWDQILAMPAPEPDLKYPTGVWHYVRGIAFLAKNQPEQAETELQQLQPLVTDADLQKLKIGENNAVTRVLSIAANVLAGELASFKGNHDQAIAALKTAVKLEDALIYTEPADWYLPARQSLGAILLKAGRASEAEQVYRDELQIYPNNGWSLLGLTQSLQAQNKIKEAKSAQQQFRSAWKYADVQLTASRF
jgi:tetratricopeptide (TPR) repeat protein